jgi:lipopolysaccharide transport system ATP-binding protein
VGDQPPGEVLIRAEHVSKKFARSLKRSLLYGAVDLFAALNPLSRPARTNGRDSSQQPPPLRPDEFWALQDVSFEVRRGECLGLIGHNGAGKSTMLKILNGLLAPDTGRVTTRGRVSALIELNAGFNPILTGRENIYNQAALIGLSRDEIESDFDKIVEFSEIGEFLDMPVQNYSSGMRVRLGFAVAAHLKPDVLIIDEVLAVGDIAFRYKSLNAIGELMRTSAVVFVSHSMPQIFRVCNEVMVLDHGQVSFQGPNVAEGVSVYMSLFHEANPTITGSQKAVISGLSISSAGVTVNEGETLKVLHGNSLQIKARIKAVTEIRSARVQFLFWSAEMLPVLEIMNDDLSGFPLEFGGNPVDVIASVEKIDLNAGKYAMTVIIVSEDYAEVMCRHDNAGYLQMEAASPSGAHAVVAGKWKVSAPTA